MYGFWDRNWAGKDIYVSGYEPWIIGYKRYTMIGKGIVIKTGMYKDKDGN